MVPTSLDAATQDSSLVCSKEHLISTGASPPTQSLPADARAVRFEIA
jgi:hypothetical protein